MTMPVEKSTNPSTDTAAQTVGGDPPPQRSRRGTRGQSATRSTATCCGSAAARWACCPHSLAWSSSPSCSSS